MQVYYQIPIRSKATLAQQKYACYGCSKPIDDGTVTKRSDYKWLYGRVSTTLNCAFWFMAGAALCSGVLRGPRFCEYSGRWYCRECHRNDRSIIPARVLQAWDFGQYRVSVRAKEFIDTIWDEAVFDVEVFNNELYSKIKALAEMRVRLRAARAAYGKIALTSRVNVCWWWTPTRFCGGSCCTCATFSRPAGRARGAHRTSLWQLRSETV